MNDNLIKHFVSSATSEAIDPSPVVAPNEEQLELLRSIAKDIKRVAEVLEAWDFHGTPSIRR